MSAARRDRLPFWRAAAVAAALAAALPSAATAAPSCPLSATRSHGATRQWSAPLDRRVSLVGRDGSLRTALDRLAAAARFRLSYAAEHVPLDRRVCDNFEAVAAGDVLVQLLAGTSLDPVVVGTDQVVLTPGRARSAAEPVAPTRAGADLLDRVVVTGTSAEAPQRALTVSLDVVDGRRLEARGVTTLAQMIDGVVPGLWIWEQSPSSLTARYGSVRGASSFGVSSPKIYIDGVEVANPLLVTQFSPGDIERVEVIRGPQGAALYGADAISGVINIVTRHEGVAPDGTRLQLRSEAGMSSSAFASLGVLAQRHVASLRAGSGTRSAGLGLSLATLGAYTPGSASRQLSANGELRVIGARTRVTAFSRFFSQRAGSAENPLLGEWSSPVAPGGEWSRASVGSRSRDTLAVSPTSPAASAAPDAPQSVQQYTVGASGTLMQNARWTHTAVVGVDGYRLANVAYYSGPLPSASDSALRASRGSADRGSVRLASVAHVGDEARAAAKLTLAAEGSLLRENTVEELVPSSAHRASGGAAWRSNTGVVAQTDVALRDALFLTAGLRVERVSGYAEVNQTAALPMVGAAWVRDFAGATLKLRSSYGKGIRPSRTASATSTMSSATQLSMTRSALAPEVQTGVEGGLDVAFGSALSLHLTRFDQRASGLIQSVAVVSGGTSAGSAWGAPCTYGYQLQSVGEITNRGWEMQGSVQRGRLTLDGAFAMIDSRVRRVVDGYTGDLRAGDRMLEVPARTASLTASWFGGGWSGSMGVARASDWVNYDRLAIARDLAASDRTIDAFVGGNLRHYWRDYDGVTRLRLSGSRDLVRGLALVFTGNNLLGQQRGEPDNVTIVPGRTVTFGMRAKF